MTKTKKLTPEELKAKADALISDATPPAVEKKRTTAKELVESIMSQGVKKINKDIEIRAAGRFKGGAYIFSTQHESVEGFCKWVLTQDPATFEMPITEAQFNFLTNLMRFEPKDCIVINGLKAYPSHPLVYRKKSGNVYDQAKFILRLEIAS